MSHNNSTLTERELAAAKQLIEELSRQLKEERSANHDLKNIYRGIEAENALLGKQLADFQAKSQLREAMLLADLQATSNAREAKHLQQIAKLEQLAVAQSTELAKTQAQLKQERHASEVRIKTLHTEYQAQINRLEGQLHSHPSSTPTGANTATAELTAGDLRDKRMTFFGGKSSKI